ncbi:MAG: helix-turn-helix transcriptional regulator [Armatimonadota bacterium]|nr:helix-turn-helix transcriptional regulator [bacterium]
MSIARATIEQDSSNLVNFVMMRRKTTKRNHLLNNLAKHMRDRRRALGITQEQLAEKSGLSTNYVARLEIADKTPSFATLIALSEALQVDASELLAGDCNRPWIGDAQEIARIMESLNERDSQFVLNQVQNTVEYLKSLRKDQS